MPTLLHTADWQIGRLYTATFPDAEAAALAEARLRAVERIAERARDERVDAVLVAGDVFDAQAVAPRTIRQLFLALEAYPGPWVMIPGNHDAALADGVWATARRLGVVPPNVHLALGPGAQTVLLEGPRLAVLCAPLTQRHTRADLTEAFDALPSPEGWHRVGLAHGAVQGLLHEGIDSVNPIAPDRAERARLDYLALGDWHGTRAIDARTWYSGTPEPDRFKDNGAGQLLRVTLDAPGRPPAVEALPVGRHRWHAEHWTLRLASDALRLAEALAAHGPDAVLDLRLEGEVDLATHRAVLEALDVAEARVRAMRRDLRGLRLLPTDEDLAALRADGYLGEVMDELRSTVRAGLRDGPPADAPGVVEPGAASGAGAAVGSAPAAVAQTALVILTGILARRQDAEGVR